MCRRGEECEASGLCLWSVFPITIGWSRCLASFDLLRPALKWHALAFSAYPAVGCTGSHFVPCLCMQQRRYQQSSVLMSSMMMQGPGPSMTHNRTQRALCMSQELAEGLTALVPGHFRGCLLQDRTSWARMPHSVPSRDETLKEYRQH